MYMVTELPDKTQLVKDVPPSSVDIGKTLLEQYQALPPIEQFMTLCDRLTRSSRILFDIVAAAEYQNFESTETRAAQDALTLMKEYGLEISGDQFYPAYKLWKKSEGIKDQVLEANSRFLIGLVSLTRQITLKEQTKNRLFQIFTAKPRPVNYLTVGKDHGLLAYFYDDPDILMEALGEAEQVDRLRNIKYWFGNVAMGVVDAAILAEITKHGGRRESYRLFRYSHYKSRDKTPVIPKSEYSNIPKGEPICVVDISLSGQSMAQSTKAFLDLGFTTYAFVTHGDPLQKGVFRQYGLETTTLWSPEKDFFLGIDRPAFYKITPMK